MRRQFFLLALLTLGACSSESNEPTITSSQGGSSFTNPVSTGGISSLGFGGATNPTTSSPSTVVSPSSQGGNVGTGGVGTTTTGNVSTTGGTTTTSKVTSTGGSTTTTKVTSTGGSSTGGTTTTGGTAGSSSTSVGSEDWVGTWASAQQLVESSATQNNRPLAPGLANNTIRQPIRVSIGGKKVRLHLSNAYGDSALEIKKVQLAASTGTTMVDDKIDTSTDTPVVFGGKADVTIAAGKVAISDPIEFDLAPLSNVAISILFGKTPSDTKLTGHPGSRTSYYLTAGDAVSSASISGAAKASHWYVISELDVMADADTHAVAIIGDSITDGRGTDDNANNRWTDVFAQLLQGNDATKKVGVLNQGAGGNQILSGGLGTPAKDRFDRDVVNPAGARWAIVFEGVNDICSANASAESLKTAYKEFITKAHTANMKIYGATITPFGKNSGYYSDAHEKVRQEVNTWIRSTGSGFDAVIDMDAAVRDPSTPINLLQSYDSNDGLHLNPAGYAKLAAAVDLKLFE